MIGIIYKIINTLNNKYCIGSTIDFNRRKQDHISGLRRNKHVNAHLQNSFNKYGEENFIFEIINTYEINNRQELYDIEDKFLKENVGNPLCYNMSDRAVGPAIFKGKDHYAFGTTLSDKRKKQNSEWSKANPIKSGQWHKPWSKETRKKILDTRNKDPNWLWQKGKKVEDDIKNHLSKTMKEKYKNGLTKQHKHKIKKNAVCEPIYQCSKDGTVIKKWDRIINAANFLGIAACNISMCLIGKNKSSAGFLWQYVNPREPKKKINQYDKENNLLFSFDTISEAAKSINLTKNNILLCLQGKRITAGGFYWRYA